MELRRYQISAGREETVNLNQVTLPAVDIAASAAFFRKMGFTQIVETPEYGRFECPQGETTFSIHQASPAPTGNGAVIYFEIEDLDRKVGQLKQLGFSFLQEPKDEPWLWREARLNDPSGNIICLYWAGENRRNPPWRIPA